MSQPWLPLLLVFSGIVVLAWPEETTVMLISLNENHGPSTIDLIGISLILIGYLPLAFQVIIKFRSVKERIGNANAVFVISLIVIGNAGITVGLMLTMDWLLWTSVGISCLGNVVLIYNAYRKDQALS